MNDSRPALREGLSAVDFKRYYWLKEELVRFCRETGLSARGPKLAIEGRVERYLATGMICDCEEKAPDSRRPARKKSEMTSPPGLDTILTSAYTSSQANRAFFESAIGPQFHFTTRFMMYCRENPDRTYGDAVREWHAEQDEKKSGQYRPPLAPQFEYNQFVRDYLGSNKDKSLKDAVQAWNQLKIIPKDRRT